jgi:phosphate transport system substrate-binding protein
VKAAVAVLSLSFVLATPANAVDLVGSGATFPQGLIDGCKAGFATSTSHSWQYSGVGSSAGRNDALANKGNFWFSDGIYTATTKPATLKHAPIVAGPIGIVYNLSGSKGETLALSADTINGIFSGAITRWNDPAIVNDSSKTVPVVTYATKNGVILKNADGTNKVLRTVNKKLGFKLPNRPIKVVYRSDGSGSTENFVNYLIGAASKDNKWVSNSTFSTAIKGSASAPFTSVDAAGNLGRFISRSGSLGVANQVAAVPDSITYVEPSYAQGNSRVASVYNASGALVDPLAAGSVASFLAAANAGSQEGTYAFNYKTTEAGAYPIAIVSYMLFYTDYASASVAAAVKQAAEYILSPACAQTVGAKLGFAVITGSAKTNADKMIAQIGSK